MGSFNVVCSISNISINSGDEIVYIPLEISKYSNKIGDSNNILLEIHCFYSPVILPLFGEYDEYGRIENIVKNKNVQIVEEYFKCSIDKIFNKKPISSGMFIKREIYDCLVKNQIDEWGDKNKLETSQLNNKYDFYKNAIRKAKNEASDMKKLLGDYNTSRLSFECYLPYSIFKFRDYITFSKIYHPEIEKGNLKNELIEFILFSFGMSAVNTFFFPACNGYQFGNKYVSKVFYKKCYKLMSSEIKKERLRDFKDECNWKIYSLLNFFKKDK